MHPCYGEKHMLSPAVKQYQIDITTLTILHSSTLSFSTIFFSSFGMGYLVLVYPPTTPAGCAKAMIPCIPNHCSSVLTPRRMDVAVPYGSGIDEAIRHYDTRPS